MQKFSEAVYGTVGVNMRMRSTFSFARKGDDGELHEMAIEF
jgi:hypothetical protein